MELLKQTVDQIQPLHQAEMKLAQKRWDSLVKPQGSLGELERLVIQYIGVTGKVMPDIPHKAVVIMAGDHGVAGQRVSAFGQQVTAQMVKNYLRGTAGANVLARHAGADLFVVDMGIKGDLPEHPRLFRCKINEGTKNFVDGPAMLRQEAEQAIEVGIQKTVMLIEQGYEVFAHAEMGIGNTTASAAIVAAFTGATPEQVVGRGSGIGEPGMQAKIDAVRRGLAINQPDSGDAIDVLTKVGGYDIGGLTGMILGAASRRKLVVLDGLISGVAALLAVSICPLSRHYLIASHRSAEPAHAVVLDRLGLCAPLDLQMRLGEGSGAALMMTLLDAGIACYRGMATFADGNVDVAEV